MSTLVYTEAGCEQLVRYLYSKTRKLPVLVISQRRDCTGPCVRGPQFQEHIGPLAKVYTLSGGIQKTFNRLLDNFYGIEPAGVRLYVPRMSTNDNPSKHQVWNQFRIDADFDEPEHFMEHVRTILAARANHIATMGANHSQKVMSFAEAERLLFKKTPPPSTIHHRSGRKVLTLPRAKPSTEQLEALQQRFKVRA